MICDHIGSPLGVGTFTPSKTLDVWKERMRKMAALKNVYVKVGGLAMANLGFGFDKRDKPPTSDELAQAWGPYVLFCVQTFGVDRVIMESNFPVDKVSCGYTVLFNALKKCVEGYSKEDKRKMFELNAKRVYSI